MTDLRDARLKRALDQAPDAASQPAQRTRSAIQAAARAAVRPWWRRLWPARSEGGPPWTAALATVLLASLVTVLWQGREIPGTRPQASGADQPAPAVTAPAPRPAPEPVPLQAPEAARARSAAERPVAAERQSTPPAAPRHRPPAAPTVHGVPPSAPAAAPAAPAPTPSPAPAAPAPLADAAGPPATEARAREETGSLRAQRQAAPAMARAGSDGMPAGNLGGWTQVRVEGEGAAIVVTRAKAGSLPELLARLLRSESSGAPPPGKAQLRLELADGDQPFGALELAGGGWRWVPLRDARPANGLRVAPALSQEVRDEAQRLLQR